MHDYLCINVGLPARLLASEDLISPAPSNAICCLTPSLNGFNYPEEEGYGT